MAEALQVLGDWHYLLSKDDFRAVLAKAEPTSEMAVFGYAERVGARNYLPDIAAHTADADTAVAAAARRAQKALGAPPQ